MVTKERMNECNEVKTFIPSYHFIFSLQIVCILCIICGNLHTVLVPSSKKVTALTKRKKKKGGKDIPPNRSPNEDKKEVSEKTVISKSNPRCF